MRRGAADDDRRPRRARPEQEPLAVRLDLVALEAACRNASAASVSAPRRRGSTPSARNSLSIQPTPTPRIRRPPDSSWIDAIHFALGSAGRYGTISTPTARPTRSVMPAERRASRAARGSARPSLPHPRAQAPGDRRPRGRRCRPPPRRARIRDQAAGRLRAHVAQVQTELHVLLRRQRQVIGDPEVVDAGLLRGARGIRDQAAGRLRAHVAQIETDLHVLLRLRGAGAISSDAMAPGDGMIEARSSGRQVERQTRS